MILLLLRLSGGKTRRFPPLLFAFGGWEEGPAVWTPPPIFFFPFFSFLSFLLFLFGALAERERVVSSLAWVLSKIRVFFAPFCDVISPLRFYIILTHWNDACSDMVGRFVYFRIGEFS